MSAWACLWEIGRWLKRLRGEGADMVGRLSGTVDWDMVTESKREKDKLCQCIKNARYSTHLILDSSNPPFSVLTRGVRAVTFG